MKKLLPITLLVLTLSATPAFAARENANEKAKFNRTEEVQVAEELSPTPTIELTVTPSVTISLTPTDIPTSIPSAKKEKKVLGKTTSTDEHVQQLVNEECAPEAEYKNHGEYVSCVAKLHVGGDVVSAAARSDIGKKNIDATPSASPTPTEPVTPPVTSAEEAIQGFNPFQSIGSLFNRFVGFFKNLI